MLNKPDEFDALVGSRYDSSGLQVAHILGRSFYNRDDMAWLRDILGNVDDSRNKLLLPESERGSAILGAAAHFGSHNSAFDAFLYNPNKSSKFLTDLKSRYDDARGPSSNPLSDQDRNALRIDLLNFIDFTRLLFLYDENLARGRFSSDNDEYSLGEWDSFGLNRSDPRFATRDDVRAYYEGDNNSSIRTNLLDNTFVRNHALFKTIEQLRASTDQDITPQLLERFPELSRILYPADGPAWATGAAAELKEIHADVISREAIISGVIDRVPSDDGKYVERVNYNGFEDIRTSSIFGQISTTVRRAIDGLTSEERASAITGEIVFDTLAGSNPELFAGTFSSLFKDLSGSTVDAYRKATGVERHALEEATRYLGIFTIAEDGNASLAGFSLPDAKALAAGATGKALAVTKTIVAEGRYGKNADEFWQWAGREIDEGDSLLIPVGDESAVVYTKVGGGSHYRIIEADNLTLTAIASTANNLAVNAEAGSSLKTVANVVGLTAQALDSGLDAAKLLLSRTYLAPVISVTEITKELLADQINFDVEFVTGNGASLSTQASEVLVGLDDAKLFGLDAGNTLIGFDRATLDGRKGNDWLLHFGSGEARGGDGDDTIIAFGSEYNGPSDRLDLYGDAGNDTLAFFQGDGGFAFGGKGNDWLWGGGAEAHLWGGEGADTFFVGASTHVEDAGTTDRVYMGPVRLVGGVKQWWMEGGTAYWAPFSTIMAGFPVIGSAVLTTAAFFVDAVTMKFASYKLLDDGSLGINIGWGFGGVASVKNYSLDLDSGVGTGGITVFEAAQGDASGASLARVEKFVNLALKAGFGVGLGGFDPLVVDLDGDGYELTTEGNSRTYFEFDTDGFGERTGWVRPDDGLLARDHNGNGSIDNVTELFGNQTTSGFTALAAHDGNADGKIDAADAVFGSLRVWQDADQDGKSDPGELKTLAELGIASISLASSIPAEPTAVGGNTIVRTGTITRTDGSTRGIADVAFQINETASRWLGSDGVSAEAAALPQLKGFGEVKDLRVAMTADAALKTMVSNFAALTTNDLGVLKANAEAILYAWAGVSATAASPLGSDEFDVRKLAFLEKFSGYTLMPRDGNGAVQTGNLAEMEALWADQVTRLTLRLVVQGPMADTFGDIGYREDIDLLVAETPTALADLYAALLDDLPSHRTQALAQWQSWAPLLGAMADGMRRADANVVRVDYIAAQLLHAMDGIAQPLDYATLAGELGIGNLAVGTSAGETLTRGGASDTAIYVGGGGSDTLTGGTGQDVYVFGRQIGNTIINDNEPSPAGDRIRFAFLSASDVTAQRDGHDLLITVKATGETVRVTGQFAPVTPLSSDVLLSSNKGVEEIQFADGAVWEIPEIMAAVGTGTDGADHMIGTMHSDVLIGGKGNDRLEGGDDADLYVVDAGDGQDVIADVQSTVLLRAADMLVLGDGIAPEDVVMSRAGASGSDLLFTIGTTGQSILIENQFNYSSLGYNAKFSTNSRIEAFAFRHYGDGWSSKDIQQKLMEQTTTSGADTTRGYGDDDTFGSSAGDDLLIGMDGADTYAWEAGSGNDAIREEAQYIDVEVGLGGLSLTVRADTVQFGANIDRSKLVFSRPTAAPDLVITNTDTGETLTVYGQFDGFQTGVLGAQWFNRMEWFTFANGSRLSWQDVQLIVTTGGTGDDRLYGDVLGDRMAGGAGNDILSGAGGGDTYVFNLGDGHDTVDDNDTSFLDDGFIQVGGAQDVLSFGVGISAGAISFGRNGSNVDLIVGATGDRVTLIGQDNYIYTGVFGNISSSRTEAIRFADGTVWSWNDLNVRMIAAATTAGNDYTLGTSTPDVFRASAGDDVLDGGDGSDTYAFGRGSGHDTIRDHVDNVFAGDNDRLDFEAGVSFADLRFARENNDLIITIADTGDSIRIDRQFDWSAYFNWHDVETFAFADGTTITKTDIQQILLTGTAGNDVLRGFSSNDLYDGGAGNDTLIDNDGNDIYVFGRGYGHDVIQESVDYVLFGDYDTLRFKAGVAPSDIVLSRSGNDLTLTVAGTSDSITVQGQFAMSAWFTWNDVEQFEFADGTIWTKNQVSTMLLTGTPGNDTMIGTGGNDYLDGGAGSDVLRGGDGSDTYVFGRGYGHDAIYESVDYVMLGDDDQVIYGTGIGPGDLSYRRDGDNLIISINGTNDILTIFGEFAYATPYTWNDIERFQFADGTILTKEEIRQIVLAGTSGNDHILGFSSGDTLDGAAGDDVLEGRDGSDTYRFGIGDGHDVVLENLDDGRSSEYDTLSFKDGVLRGDVTVTREGQDAIFTLSSDDSIRVQDHFNEGYNEFLSFNDVERVLFADGTEWDKIEIDRRSIHPTDGDDLMLGSRYAQTYDGGTGNDTIYAGTNNDVLIGGLGNDRLEGESGDDVYRYNLGDGNDVIRDYTYGNDGADRIVFGAGIAASDLRFAHNPNDASEILISFADKPGSIGVLNQWWNDAGVEFLEFADGTVWGQDLIAAAWVAQQATTGDDLIFGSEGNDTVASGVGNDVIRAAGGDDLITGGNGNDRLEGAYGNDVYVYNLGDGDDVIYDYSWNNDQADRIRFGAGITSTSLQFANNGDYSDMVIRFANEAGSIAVQRQWWGDAGVEFLEFADGTVWDQAQIAARYLADQSTAGDDLILGTPLGSTVKAGAGNDRVLTGDADDVITGGIGNDRLESGYGNDVYVYNLGDGDDSIYDYSWNNDQADRIRFGAGISASDLLVSRAASGDDLQLSFKSAEGSILLVREYWDDAGIEFFDFLDGTTLTQAQIEGRILSSTSGDDLLVGTEGTDELWGLDGNDTLRGRSGGDRLGGGRGNDRLVGGEGDDHLEGGTGDDQLVGDEDGPLSTGPNLLANGSFEQSGTVTGSHGWGLANADLPGWTKTNSQPFQQVYQGLNSVRSTDGAFWIDMDADGGSGSNMVIHQTVGGLAAGQIFNLEFEHANRVSASTGGLQVRWNGAVIATYTASHIDMRGERLSVTALAGDNLVTFTGVGDADGNGASLDNVRLYATADSSSVAGNDRLYGGGGNDLIQGGDGDDVLEGGADDDILYGDTVSWTKTGPNLIANGSFEQVDVSAQYTSWGISSHALPGWTKVNSGAFNQVRSGVDRVTASDGTYVMDLDDTGGAGSNMDIRQAINGLTAGQRLSLEFDHGNATSVASGTFEVWWNDILLATIAEAGTQMRSKTFEVTASEGTNVLRLRGLNQEDGLGSQIDDVQLFQISATSSGDGNDTIEGGLGDDQIIGGAGSDTVLFSGTDTGFDAVQGGVGSDVLKATASGTVIGLKAISEVETITADSFTGVVISGSAGADILNFSGMTLTGITRIDGGAGADTITGSSAMDIIVGGAGDDILGGGAGNDVFSYTGAENGFDAVDGGGGTDTIRAEAAGTIIGLRSSNVGTITANGFANVSIQGSAGNDILNFGSTALTGIARIDGGAGNDTLTGSAAADTIQGGIGADTISGGNGNDTLDGGADSDVLTGGGNDDVIQGGSGDDTVNFATGAGYDAVDGGAGTDKIHATAANTLIGLSSLVGIELITAGAFSGVSIAGSGTANILDFSSVALTGIGKIDGGSGNDTIIGTGLNDVIIGSAGDDILRGGAGNDVFQVTGTGSGFDLVEGGDGSDTISALANGTVIGLSSISGVETVTAGGFTGVYVLGSAASDTFNFTSVALSGIGRIDGGAGADAIVGSSAADVIAGGTGDDTLSGGLGDDTFQFTGTTGGADAIDGGSGQDTITALANATVIGLRSLTGVEAITAGAFTGVSILGSANADQLNFAVVNLTGITKIDAGAGNDLVTGSAASDVLLSSVGDDQLLGEAGDDTFQYSGTSGGFDAVNGGAGSDTIAALANSTVIGLSTLTGVETITAGTFTAVTISGSANADVLDFSAVTLTGIVRVVGGSGNDTLTGNAAANILWGGIGNDLVQGGAGDDSLAGDDGDDVLVGGIGNDALAGGNGVDTADYASSTVSLTINLGLTTAQTIAAGETDTLTTIENLITGSGADIITGSIAANNLKAGAGNDRITGGLGNDSLDGGLGLDTAVFAGTKATYSIVTSAGTTTIKDNAATTDGNDGTDTLVGIETAQFKDAAQGLAAPIILDLDGNGVRGVDQSRSKAKFDWDGNGRRDSTAWVGKGDGLLVFDRNGDGKVNRANELSFINDKPGAKSDLDGLSAFDSNGDGLFSALDEQWSSFRVWVDKDTDGSVDKRELRTMKEVGVASINLVGEATDRSWNWGEVVTVNTGSFTRTDGSTGGFSDVVLSYAATSRPSMNAALLSHDMPIQETAEQLGMMRYASFWTDYALV